jgi:ferredoxin-type protein NapH
MIGRINRIWWQITGVLLFNFPFVGHLTLFPWLTIPVLNCYSCPLAQGACPVGTWQHFIVIGAIPFFAIGVVAVWSLSAGRFFCGHLCPFGFFQDLMARIRKRHIRLPRWTGHLKYASLIILTLIMPPIVLEPFFCTLCPAGTLEAGIPLVAQSWIKATYGEQGMFGFGSGIHTMVGWWFWFKVGILFSFIVGMVLTRRPFCRMACPMGAVLGLANRISLFVHPPEVLPGERPRHKLKDCPVHITNPHDIDSNACIKCRQCYREPVKPVEQSATENTEKH